MTTMRALKATLLDDDAFRLCAIPFGGPIPQKGAPRGVDLDGEWFSPRTDIKPDWFPLRLVDWHHGHDATMGRAVLGKAVDLGPFGGAGSEPDEDGWWVTVWLAHGERRVDLVKQARRARRPDLRLVRVRRRARPESRYRRDPRVALRAADALDLATEHALRPAPPQGDPRRVSRRGHAAGCGVLGRYRTRDARPRRFPS